MRSSRVLRALAAGVAIAACAAPPKPPPKGPPPAIVAATFERLSLRANAFVDLHAWLATHATGEGGYALTVGERGERLRERAALALSDCADARCADDALAGTIFATEHRAARASFFAGPWGDRAVTDHAAIEIGASALGPEADALLERVARDLELTLPSSPIPVDIVAEAPPAGSTTLIPEMLAAEGPCFYARRRDEARVKRARVVDCLLVRAALRIGRASPAAVALARAEGEARGDRLWKMIVVQAVAATVASWEPKHASVDRRFAEAAEPQGMKWLNEAWPKHEDPIADFAARLAARLRDERR